MAGGVNGVALDPSGDMVVSAAGTRGSFEPLTFERWCALAGPGAVMVDVGAYTGLYAIAAAQRGASVYAFEPNPAAFRRLLANARTNKVEVHAKQVALWCEASVLPLSLKGGRMLTSAGSLVRQHGPAIDATCLPLDGYELLKVRAIKIDVERAEAEVIQGAMRTIMRDRPTIFAEVLDMEIGDRIDGLLGPHGYRREALDKAMFVWAP